MSDEAKDEPPQDARALAAVSRSQRILAAGEVLFEEGEAGDCAYMVERGSLRATLQVDGRERLLYEFGPGDLLGELGLMSDGVRAATVVAQTRVEMAVITRQQFERELQASVPLVSIVSRIVMERFAKISVAHQSGESTWIDSPRSATTPQLDTTREQALRDIQLERQLEQGLERREFELHYQPILALETGALCGFEALVRWRRPGGGLVPPSEFIGIAERCGLIVPIGTWVLGQAVAFAAQALPREPGLASESPAPFVSVNLSPRQFARQEDVAGLARVIENAVIEPGRVKLEVTESLLIDNTQSAVAALRQLKRVGVTLAIDDFGTGYASLNYLTRYPLDTLKIDRSFVANIEQEGTAKVIRSMIVLADSLGMDVVAEGVETRAQAQALARLECGYVQGFLYSRPMPRNEALQFANGSIRHDPTRTTQTADASK